ncbi:MAG: RNA methyltransferase [Desulfurococcales archaeon]|nr:RNA methyltransferase [Desulfurococcales archaeon]
MRSFRLVLVEPEGKINFGFILRLARNFNISDICVVRPRFDLTDSEVLEFAAGGAEAAKYCRVCENIDECLEDVRVSICTTSKVGSEKDVLRQGVPINALRYVLPSEGVIAIVFGRESVGLTREELSKCDIISTIPLKSEYNVMNLSHAVALYLYELSRTESPENQKLTVGAECNKNTFKAILGLVREISTASDEPEEVFIALRHVLARASLTKPECSILYRFLKKLAYELGLKARTCSNTQ